MLGLKTNAFGIGESGFRRVHEIEAQVEFVGGSTDAEAIAVPILGFDVLAIRERDPRLRRGGLPRPRNQTKHQNADSSVNLLEHRGKIIACPPCPSTRL